MAAHDAGSCGRHATKLRSVSREHFCSALQLLLEMWKEIFPACSHTSCALLKFTGVVRGNELRETEAVESWHAMMQKPLQPKSAKYFKALERLLGAPPTCYLACEYRDVEALFGSVSLEGMEDLQMLERYRSAEMTPEDRAAFWSHLQTLNRCALQHQGAEMQPVPTRAAIEQNIAEHKLSKRSVLADAEAPGGGAPSRASAPPSMETAFANTFASFVAALGEGAPGPCALREFAEGAASPERSEVLMEAWSAVSKAAREEIDAACREASRERLTASAAWGAALPEAAAKALTLRLQHCTDEQLRAGCAHLQQLNSFCSMRAHVPAGMMNKIESYVQRMTEEIQEGRCDLSSIDLQSFGNELLSSCSPEDMSLFAANLGELLPTLANISSQLPPHLLQQAHASSPANILEVQE